MTAYYNEIDPYAAQWLRNLMAENLIAKGEVDERSITEVQPGDLAGFDQCHFFAGIGGWSLALRLAGWPDNRPVWTGSCPCQPFSIAGRQKGFSDKRHLWPEFYRLIRQCRPTVVFGEQVARGIAMQWLDSVALDFEKESYAFGAADLCSSAYEIGQERQRLYFAAHPIGAAATGWNPTVGRERRQAPVAANREYPDWRSCCEAGVLDDGLPPGLAKKITSGFGNAIIPQVAAEFIKAYGS